MSIKSLSMGVHFNRASGERRPDGAILVVFCQSKRLELTGIWNPWKAPAVSGDTGYDDRDWERSLSQAAGPMNACRSPNTLTGGRGTAVRPVPPGRVRLRGRVSRVSKRGKQAPRPAPVAGMDLTPRSNTLAGNTWTQNEGAQRPFGQVLGTVAGEQWVPRPRTVSRSSLMMYLRKNHRVRPEPAVHAALGLVEFPRDAMSKARSNSLSFAQVITEGPLRLPHAV